MLEDQFLHAAGALVADDIVVGGLAADDAAERQIAVERPALDLDRRLDRHLDGGRNLQHAGHGKALIAGARLLQRGNRALRQLIGDIGIEARFHDHDMRRRRHSLTPLVVRRCCGR